MIIAKTATLLHQFEMMQLISINDMCAKLGKSRATIHRWVTAKKLIPPVYRNKRTIGWCPISFEEWQSTQI